LIVVSHDRYFMDKIAEQTFVFEGNGNIKVHIGNYTDFRAEKSEAPTTKPKEVKPEPQPVIQKTETPKTKAKVAMTFKEKYEYENIEAEIAKLEQRKAELEQDLDKNLSNSEKLASISAELGKTIEQLEERTMRWMELEEKAGN
jgi:ATP-binding cassette subfamily F protein uup